MINCKPCKTLLASKGIASKKEFHKWSVRGGHPDKGGNQSIFQDVSNCNDLYFGNDARCNWGATRISPMKRSSVPTPRNYGSPSSTGTARGFSSPSPSPKKRKSKSPRKSPRNPCKPGKVKNAKGRCVKAENAHKSPRKRS